MPNVKRIELTYDPGATLEVLILDQTTGYILDDADGVFRDTPADSKVAIAEHATIDGFYVLLESRSDWPDGLKTIIVYEAGGVVPIRSFTMSISGDDTTVVPSPSGTVKYSEVIDVVKVILRDKEGANWNASTDLLPLLEIMVQTIVTILANQNPEMVWIPSDIVLDTVTGYGPYYIEETGLPIDFKYIARMETDQGPEVVKGSRDKSYHRSSTGRPDRYWTEGFGNTKIYFNRSIPVGATYTYPVWYIPLVARNVNDVEQVIPLPPMFFESLVFWLAKLAGNIDEYITTGEEDMISLLTPVVNSVLDARTSELEVSVDGLGF